VTSIGVVMPGHDRSNRCTAAPLDSYSRPLPPDGQRKTTQKFRQLKADTMSKTAFRNQRLIMVI